MIARVFHGSDNGKYKKRKEKKKKRKRNIQDRRAKRPIMGAALDSGIQEIGLALCTTIAAASRRRTPWQIDKKSNERGLTWLVIFILLITSIRTAFVLAQSKNPAR
jgi:hypothetical protein